MSWVCRVHCMSRGANLVTIKQQAINDFFLDEIRGRHKDKHINKKLLVSYALDGCYISVLSHIPRLWVIRKLLDWVKLKP